MLYEYMLAGLRVLCEVPFPLTVSEESREFLRSADASVAAEVYFKISSVSALEPPVQAHYLHGRHYGEGKTWFCTGQAHAPYACIERCEGTPLRLNCHYLEGYEDYFRFSNRLCDLLGLETVLLLHEAFLLHAAFIELQGRGILFSAPSGTGKSTQAALWEQYTGAKILNGDRAAVRYLDGRWQAFGLPYAGSSQVYCNASAPCSAIVVLRQAEENRLTRLSQKEALLALYPETTVHEWDKKQVELAVTHLLKLTQTVPVYRLDCLPNEAAVRLLYDEVMP